MEKNERLAWRTKPRTYCRCFSSCPKRHCKGRPFQLQIRKKQLFRPRKVVFLFSPSRHSWEPGTKLFRCLFQLPDKGRPFQLQIKKKLFRPRKVVFYFPFQLTLLEQALSFSGAFSSCPKRHCKGKVVFFVFPSRHFWEPGTKLFRCLSSCPKRHCKGRPFRLQIIKKNNFSRPRKVVFLFSLPETVGSQALSFSGAFSSCPKRHCKGRPFQLQIRKKQLFRPRKVVFLFSLPDTHWEQALSFSGAFSSCPKRHCKGRPFQLQIRKKNNFSGPEKLFFYFPFQRLLGARH